MLMRNIHLYLLLLATAGVLAACGSEQTETVTAICKARSPLISS